MISVVPLGGTNLSFSSLVNRRRDYSREVISTKASNSVRSPEVLSIQESNIYKDVAQGKAPSPLVGIYDLSVYADKSSGTAVQQVAVHEPFAFLHEVHHFSTGVIQGRIVHPTTEHTSSPDSHDIAQIAEVQLRSHMVRGSQKKDTLMPRFLLSNVIQNEPSAAVSVDLSDCRISTSYMQSPADMFRSRSLQNVILSPTQSKPIYQRKLVFLGLQEVGKTSLCKCFESEPFFFMSLPDVRTTTGIRVRERYMKVDGDSVKCILSDFSGQETYHSHGYFLTERSVFALVWKVYVDGQTSQSGGINEVEENRLYMWVSEIYAKFPCARIVLIATHLDELRVQSQYAVKMILNKMKTKIFDFISRATVTRSVMLHKHERGIHKYGAAVAPSSIIAGSFAVSCKTRRIIAADDHLQNISGKRISTLFNYMGTVLKMDSINDREYPLGIVPGRHMLVIEGIEKIKRTEPDKLLMPITELVDMAVRMGVASDGELMQVARLMHSWDVIYLLKHNKIEDNLYVVLHTPWLRRIAASLFSYTHVLHTPLHLRCYVEGLEYTVSHAETSDLSLMRTGFLRLPLARILFHKPLSDFLKRAPSDLDISMCLQLLKAMDLLYVVCMDCDEENIIMEETLVNPDADIPVVREGRIIRYFVPSLAPYRVPPLLQRLAPLLFQRGMRMRMSFNLLPDELWSRMQCRLHIHLQEVSVFVPHNGFIDYVREQEITLLSGLRLKEASKEHNRWRDAMWLGNSTCRVFMYRDGLTDISMYSTESSPDSSKMILQTIEDIVSELMKEYPGVQRNTYVVCSNPSCGGWLGASLLAYNGKTTCSICAKKFGNKQVVSAGAEQLRSKSFSKVILDELHRLLPLCIVPRSCEYVYNYLGLPSNELVHDNKDDNTHSKSDSGRTFLGNNEKPSSNLHVDYTHMLDKVVQVALYNAWVDRVNEQNTL
ncbi:unnamed protein product [Phytomonas sp. EM1]|nr:unnamed protein product [Phytomonas sp. EM1]|eukprot:CCW60336.1 unnamed protein product [Phytomonas sp. isolate EM1]